MYCTALWLRFDTTCSTKHQLFYKEHSVRNQAPQYPKGQTLFVLNVPPWASSDSLKEAFDNICGPVNLITLTSAAGDTSKSGFGTAYIVFERESGLDKALELPLNVTLTLHTEENKSIVGVKSKLHFVAVSR